MQRLFWLLLLGVAAPGGPADEVPRGAGTVTLPLAEFDRLTERARQVKPRPEPPPAPSVLTRAEYHLTVKDSLVRGSLNLEGSVLASALTRVPLFTGATVLEARAAGKPVALSGQGGALEALLGPGPFRLELELVLPVSNEPGRASALLPALQAGIIQAYFDLPGERAELKLDSGLATERSGKAGRTTAVATLVPNAASRVSWTARETGSSSEPARPARFFAELKNVLSVGEADLQLATLVDVTVVEGEPQRFELTLPAGFELRSVSGPTLDATREDQGALTLAVREPHARRHQFLLALQRAGEAGSFESRLQLPSLRGVQRENGELGLAAAGTLDLQGREEAPLRRIDVSEVGPALLGLAREPLLAAFRYQRHGVEPASLVLDVKRFPSAAVLAALCERATATTLVTAEGRMLTELKLTVRNQAQPFLKVGLPPGVTLVSAEVAGQGVKPVLGEDGTRVPLLRAGFRPSGPYEVSFVYLTAGEAFGQRGVGALELPRLDLPINLLTWELFLPDRYQVKEFGGDAFPGELPSAPTRVLDVGGDAASFSRLTPGVVADSSAAPLAVAGVIGRVTDSQGGALPGATLTLRDAAGRQRTTASDANGWYYFAGLTPGDYSLHGQLVGFNEHRRSLRYSQGRYVANVSLQVGAVSESIEVSASRVDKLDRRERDEPVSQRAPENVFALQRRVSGVLPVRIDVPAAGTSFHFVRPLVLDEPTRLTFKYKARRGR